MTGRDEDDRVDGLVAAYLAEQARAVDGAALFAQARHRLRMRRIWRVASLAALVAASVAVAVGVFLWSGSPGTPPSKGGTSPALIAAQTGLDAVSAVGMLRTAATAPLKEAAQDLRASILPSGGLSLDGAGRLTQLRLTAASDARAVGGKVRALFSQSLQQSGLVI